MAVNDLSDQLIESIKDILERGKVEIEAALAAKGYNEQIAYIYSEEQHQTELFPAIQITQVTREVEWAATRVRNETYKFTIDCMVKTLKREESGRYIRCFASACQNWMNSFENLRYFVTGTKVMVYDSFCPVVTYGFKREGIIRVGRLEYFAKTQNFYAALP